MNEELKQMEEESTDLAGICGGGVGIVLARMDSHPEEFHSDCDKWKFIYKDYFRDAMSETEKGMIFDKIKKIRQQEFTQMVLQTLVPCENAEDEEDDDDWADKQMSKFGRAPVKNEGATIKYDAKNRYTWEKDNGRK